MAMQIIRAACAPRAPSAPYARAVPDTRPLARGLRAGRAPNRRGMPREPAKRFLQQPDDDPRTDAFPGSAPATRLADRTSRPFAKEPRVNQTTDLLSYLVTSQLAARMRSGAWLTTGQLVDVQRMWLACHRAECGWLARIRIADASVTIAQGIYDIAIANRDPDSGERVRLDADSPELNALRERCDALLQRIDGSRDVDAW